MEALPHISVPIGLQWENAYCKQAGLLFFYSVQSYSQWQWGATLRGVGWWKCGRCQRRQMICFTFDFQVD